MPIDKKGNKANKTAVKKAVTINKTVALVSLIMVLLFAIYFLFKPSKPERALEQHKEMSEAGGVEESSIEIQAPPAEGKEEKKRNTPPEVTKARLQLASANNTDIIKVIAEGTDRDGDPVTFQYAWTKNNETAGEGDTIREFKRGDRLYVKITPFDGKDYGQPRTITTEIKNTTPRVIEHAEINIDNNLLAYQVKAFDPDGDTLTYSLIEVPEGMTIDETSGLIKWPVDPGSYGKKYGIKVKISDNHGGEVVYSLNLSL